MKEDLILKENEAKEMVDMVEGYSRQVVVFNDCPESIDSFKKMLIADDYDFTLIGNLDDFKTSFNQDKIIKAATSRLPAVVISLDVNFISAVQIYKKVKKVMPEARCAFTSKAFQPEQLEECMALGVSAFFTHPLDYKDFINWLEEGRDSAQAEAFNPDDYSYAFLH
jgi:DNA-binding NarL/FixJ family response regulator